VAATMQTRIHNTHYHYRYKPLTPVSDTPSVMLSNSELRDMSLAPSAVLPATVTISHPQLRDLILPLKRGHVLYPCRSAVYEQRWTSPEDPTTGMDDGKVRQSTAQELFKLSFTPTCITTK